MSKQVNVRLDHLTLERLNLISLYLSALRGKKSTTTYSITSCISEYYYSILRDADGADMEVMDYIEFLKSL